MFLACDTIPRFLLLCMDIWGGGENLFLCSLGEWTYSYRAALPMNPASPFIGGTPCPAAACPSPAERHKKIPPPVPLHLQPVPRFPVSTGLVRLHLIRTVSACWRAATGHYFAKYLFSELQIYALSFFCSRFWMFCINSLSASVTASAVISI